MSAYGLGDAIDAKSSKYFSEQHKKSNKKSLNIYSTENILSIVAENKDNKAKEAELLKRHRAGSSLLPVN